MRKKSVLALLLALMMILSGCTLVTKDEEKDNARVIIDVNGETVTKHVVTAAVQNQISQNEYYNQMFAAYGYSGVYSTDEATVTAQVIDSFVENLVLKQKAYAMGMNELTDEEKAKAEEHAKEYYESFLSSVISAYLPNSGLEGDELNAAAEKYVAENDIKTADGRSTYEDFLQSAIDEQAIEKLKADIVKDVTVTEEEIQADFDAKVESDKADSETNADNYGYNLMNNIAVYYAPAGYRMVKQILITVSDEDSKAADEANTALTEAKNALESAGEDADKDALQAAVDAAQAAYDEAKATGMANAKAKAEEVLALATAEGADFDALVSEYSSDNMPESGYAVREGFAYFVEPFVNGAMALQNVGDISEPVESSYGYHIIKYVSDVAEGPVDIETVRAGITDSLLMAKQDELTETTIKQWISEANAKTYPDRLN
ncbi:MAG: peptidylprolyl isomerase [Clostridia bacterium]|nr:peptidylprolyl isomerase [Clostridia bacterium]